MLTLDIPDLRKMRLKFDGEKVLARASTGAASAIRRRWKSGQGAEGAMPDADNEPWSNTRPMHRTGQMEKSIKGYWGKRDRDIRWVGPHGNRVDERFFGGGGIKRNALVYYVNVHNRPDLKASSPLGTDDRVNAKATQFAIRAMQKQAQTGDLNLLLELRRHRRRSR